MLLGKSQKLSSFSSVSDGIYKIFQSTLLNVGDSIFHKSFMENKFYKRRFETLISKFTKTLENTGDSQVVMLRPATKEQMNSE